MTGRANIVERGIEIAYRLIPVLVLFSLPFSLEGGLRWLGLFGFVPLLMWAGGCRSCGTRGRAGDGTNQGTSFPCY